MKDKTPVFGFLNNKRVRLHVVKDTKAKTLRPIIERLAAKGSLILTDNWKAYKNLGQDGYGHIAVNHMGKQYTRGAFSVNAVENVWSLFKRCIYGIYHNASRKHLSRYCDEISYRFNTRFLTDADRFALTLRNSYGRLSYKSLVARK